MSQRYSPDSTSQVPSSTTHKSQDIKSKMRVLKNTLNEVGIQLSFGEEPHNLTQEQALVVRDLESLFRNSPTETLDDFVDAFKIICKKEKYFKKALMLTKFTTNDSNLTVGGKHRNIEQESLLRLFLKVSFLQRQTVEILLDNIAAIASEADQDTSWLRLLLSPLRYLPYNQNAETFYIKLLDILDIATQPVQLEILDSIPEIIPDSLYSRTAEQLCKLMDEQDELTGAIIDCLNALDLEQDTRAQVQDIILSKILSGSSLKEFPVLLSFLMTDCKSQNLVQTLLKIRNILDNIMLSTNDKLKQKETSKILIFNKLQAFAISPKIVSEAWLNMISSIKIHTDHKPVDYLILFMLHATVHAKKRIIEVIFKKRVHMGLFKIVQLEKMFEKYLPQQLLKDYFTSMVEIGCSLLRYSNDQTTVEFASTLFSILFSHEHTETIHQREILDSLLILTGSSDKRTVSNVLKLLSSLLEFKKKLQQHTIMLLRLLEKLDTFDLHDVKEVFEILCTLTCGELADNMSGLRDEIHMVVRKQLYSTKKIVKYRGIISAVVLVRHLVLTNSVEQDELCEPPTIRSISDLPYGQPREAGTLLELTSTCTTGSAELMGLYYDQVAAMLLPNTDLDKYFLNWLHDTVADNFKKHYLVDVVSETVNDLEMTMQCMLYREEDMEEQLGINIAGLTLKNDTSVLLLAPHFRLLRLLHYRLYNRDLSSLVALLGCPILLPEVKDYDDLESDQVKQVADCLFHCANWFRELISGFVTQKDRKKRSSVVKRLKDLLDVEQKLQKCIEKCPDHKLPTSYFDYVSELLKQSTSPKQEVKTKNPPKKKLKSATTVQDTNDTMGNLTIDDSVTKRKKSVTKHVGIEHQINFREMDTDLVLLLKYPLNISNQDESPNPTQTTTLSIDQLIFILKDFVLKLSTLTKGKNVGLSHLHMIRPVHLITDATVLLPKMDAHLKVVLRNIKDLFDSNAGRQDVPNMFTEDALQLKLCFGLMLEVFYLIFSWPGFQHSSNLELLKNLLKSMRTSDQSQAPHSANRLIVEFITDLSNYTGQCLQISQAVDLVNTMETLYAATTPNSDTEKKIVLTASKLLSRRWYNSKGNIESGKSYNEKIDVLVKVYLRSANVKTICGLIGTLQEQADSLKLKEDYLEMLPSIDKQCFHIFYSGLCTALLNRVKSEVESLTNSEHLNLWKTTTLSMGGLMSITKIHETKTVLACFLKKSIGILKIFLSHGIPIMELTLRSKSDEVVAVFKALQTSTRFLHHLCCYSKLTKDSRLMAFVPKFKLTLETLVYRVKAVLVANNCSAAFWMGNLRNRDLHGDDILSQSSIVTEENGAEDSDESLPNDDDTDIESNTSSNRVDGSISSEVFD